MKNLLQLTKHRQTRHDQAQFDRATRLERIITLATRR
jgi:hypothetical protein